MPQPAEQHYDGKIDKSPGSASPAAAEWDVEVVA
jgi:hypothetical protein